MTELPRIEAMDGRFEALLRPDSRFELIADGLVFAEGPLWMPEDEALVWSDVRADRMWRWTKEGGASVLRDPSGIANGNALDGEGRLITCEMGGRRVVRIERDGSITVLADSYDGGKLNSPNDVVVKSDGAVWFTDARAYLEPGCTGLHRGRRFVFERPVSAPPCCAATALHVPKYVPMSG